MKAQFTSHQTYGIRFYLRRIADLGTIGFNGTTNMVRLSTPHDFDRHTLTLYLDSVECTYYAALGESEAIVIPLMEYLFLVSKLF